MKAFASLSSSIRHGFVIFGQDQTDRASAKSSCKGNTFGAHSCYSLDIEVFFELPPETIAILRGWS